VHDLTLDQLLQGRFGAFDVHQQVGMVQPAIKALGFQRVQLRAKLWLKPLISLYNPVSFKPGK
jgi:hypothetical protein